MVRVPVVYSFGLVERYFMERVFHAKAINGADHFFTFRDTKVEWPLGDSFPWDGTTTPELRVREIVTESNYTDLNDCVIEELTCSWNEYHPRIHRPYLNINQYHPSRPIPIGDTLECPLDVPKANGTPWMKSEPYPIDREWYPKSLTHLRVMADELRQIYQHIEPTNANMECFGHKSRNLLIIACTEAEAQWVGILKANSYTMPDRPNTNDYVKLVAPLHLKDYRVTLPAYPDVPTISPFGNWEISKPTESLSWYNSYNKTKHDRAAHFKSATLLQATSAVAACAVLLVAQFGRRLDWAEEIGAFFAFESFPSWPDKEHYLRQLDRVVTHKPKPYRF